MGAFVVMEMETMTFITYKKLHVYKVKVSIICIIIYIKILGMLWQYIASLHVIPKPCSSKCVATFI
jgi:hypothetical protein